MEKEKQYRCECPFCHNYILLTDILPNGLHLCFFADFTLENGSFTKARCFPSITHQKRNTKPKEREIKFDETSNTKEIF